MADYDQVSAQIIGLSARLHKGFEIVVLSRFLHSMKRSRHLCS